jgi:hypothetical protein
MQLLFHSGTKIISLFAIVGVQYYEEEENGCNAHQNRPTSAQNVEKPTGVFITKRLAEWSG